MKIKYKMAPDAIVKFNNTKLHLQCLLENKLTKTGMQGAQTKVIKAHSRSKNQSKIQYYSNTNTSMPYNIWVSDIDDYIPNIPNKDTLTVYNMEQLFDKEKFEKFLKQE